MQTTVGRLLLSQALPADAYDPSQSLDAKGVKDLMKKLAIEHADDYPSIAKKLMDLGREAGYRSGGYTFSPEDLLSPTAVEPERDLLRTRVRELLTDRRAGSSPQSRAKRVVNLLMEAKQGLIDKTLATGKASQNPLAMQVFSGTRGNPGNLASLQVGDLLYSDHHNREIPYPVLSSYSEGLSPAEWFAATFGARKSLADTKLAVADSGYFCLAAGTYVRMADGSPKRIEDIEVGDFVLGADIHGHTSPTRVTETFDNGPRKVFQFRFVYDGLLDREPVDICATENHRVLASVYGTNVKRIVPLRDAFDFYRLETCAPAGVTDEDCLILSRVYMGLLPTFDIEVANDDHLFVLDNGAIVANSKQLGRAAHRLLVTDVDDEDTSRNTQRGLPVETSDPDNEGSLLSFPVAGYKRNTLLTSKVLRDLKDRGIEKIVVRSPLTSYPQGGGLYARDVGVRERGGLPARGDFVGRAAADAVGETATQSTLGAKHGGGIAGASKLSGFKLLNQLVQAPKDSPHWATHAALPGSVGRITEAPGGGKFASIDGVPHYIQQGQELHVKSGDRVEAGDQISNGIPNPVMLATHKGLGEAARLYVDALRKAMKGSGLSANRRNLELQTRGILNYVRFNQPHNDHLPEDVISYDALENEWEPREGSRTRHVRDAAGSYLEKPVLHHTIGTKLTKPMIEELHHFGVKEVTTHHEPPPFQAEFVRGADNLRYDPDWLTRMYGSYQGRSFRDAVYSNAVSDEAGTSFVPSAARGPALNRTKGPVKSYDPAEIIKPKTTGVSVL